ncbi:MAG: ABC transporter ATPase [Bacteroidetes bacterium]|nr:MAG: ABC transporter ATPase [Bacteroidota bacterium]
MNYLSVETVSKSYGARVLFSDLSFGLSKGDKTALVAKNGAGKTSLLNIICGKDKPDSGIVTLRKDITVAVLMQDPVFDDTKTVIEIAVSGDTPLLKTVREYEELIALSESDHSDETQLRLQNAGERMDELKAWDTESKVRQMLGKLGLHQPAQEVNTLSGGQKKRLALAQVLLSEPDFLILDEPTNHLDVDMIEWLENYLASKDLTLLLVTHDRYFLDRVCTSIIELEDGKLYHYDGNFTYYIERKAEREIAQEASLEKAKNLYRRELEWVRKMPRARGTKAKSRVDAFKDVEKEAKGKRKEEELQLQVKMTRLGGKILELIRIRKKYGDKIILDGFDYTFKRGEKIGIVGPNGIGKSTLLNIVLGNEPYDSGKIQTGETVVFGYYAQQGMQLKEDKRVIEVIKDIADVFPLADGKNLSASQMLQRFLFAPHTHYSYVSTLSGGERRRLFLLTVLMKNPNFLILDEPTNDLDILTLGVLEDFLTDFPGCVLIVSHDRYFMDKLVDHLFIFEGDGIIKDFPGNYTQWREHQPEKEKRIPAVNTSPKPIEAEIKTTPVNDAAPAKRKLSFREKSEHEQLEKEIAQLEKEKTEITALLSAESDHEKLQKAAARFGEIDKLLETKMLRWMELDELYSLS